MKEKQQEEREELSMEQKEKLEHHVDIEPQRDPEKPQHSED
ncbi:hypothetical protein JOC78_000588 [Bacillus ectoiniformans]|nr:3-methyladenine DNA glycosylase [Bacillus ectoiniformans]MBM7647667.1 hypothetical protein [Bacillus ectoiniformans]